MMMGTFRLSAGEAAGRATTVARLAVPQRAVPNADNFSFDDAVNAHIKWKTRLVDYIEGRSSEKLEVEKVSCDDKCDLGKWLYGSAKVHQNLGEYADLKSSHAAFHRSVGGIVQCVHDHRKEEATSKLGGEFFQLSNQTIRAIKSLQAKVEGNQLSAKATRNSDEWQDF
jgi:methyl-accepting chemotaxis protein